MNNTNKTFSLSNLTTLHTQAAVVFIGSILICICFFLLAPDFVLDKSCGDCDGGYIAPAKNFLTGNGWTDNNGNFPTARPPGHSLIMVALIKLAAVFDLREDLVYWVFNTIAISISSVLLLFLSRLIWGYQRILILPFIWMTCPYVLWFLNQPYSEIPFFVLFFSTVLLALLSYRNTGSRQYVLTLLTGITSAMSMLVRPAGIGLPIVICSVFLLTVSKRDLRHLAKYVTALALGVIIIITPWSAITYQNTGQAMLLTDGTLMRASLRNGVTFASDEPIRQQIQLPKRVVNLMNNLEAVLDSRIRGLELTRSIVRVLSEKPLVTLHFVSIKMLRSWYATYTHKHENFSLGLQILYLAITLYAAIRGVICRILPQDFALLASFITLYFWFLSTLFEPLVRYMIPAMGLLFLFLPVLWRSKTLNKTQNIP